MTRRAFTLTEILIATMIFMVVSGAMLAIFNAATALYQQGIAARSANDDAISTFELLRRDISRALGPDSGHFYARLLRDGNCRIGWTIRFKEPKLLTNEQNEDITSTRAFVLWGLNGEQLLRQEKPLQNNQRPQNLQLDQDTGAEVVSTRCLHFSVRLAGATQVLANAPYFILDSRPDINPNENRLGRSTRWSWTRPVDPELPAFPAQPNSLEDSLLYATWNEWQVNGVSTTPQFPASMRISLILDGSIEAQAGPQRIGLLTRELAQDATDTPIAVRGLRQWTPGPGSVLRLGPNPNDDNEPAYEWIGVHDARTEGYLINTAWSHGPVFQDADILTGRGILRSEPLRHPPRTEVRTGRLFHYVVPFRL